MKRNLTLLAILFLLLGVTYYLQEVRVKEEKAKREAKTQLLKTDDLGKLKAIHMENVTLEKRGEDYFVLPENVKANVDKVNFFLGHLSQLRIRRVLSKEELSDVGREAFFPKSSPSFEFEFSGGSLSFLLGDKVNVDRSFYVEIGKKGEKLQAVAYDKTPREGVYSKKKAHRDDESYTKLKTLLNLPKNFFYDTSLLLNPPEYIQVSEVLMGNERNRSFEINVRENVTDPPSYKGIDYDEKKIKSYVTSLIQLEGKTLILPDRFKKLKEIQSEIFLRIQKGEKLRTVKLELFNEFEREKETERGSFVRVRAWPGADDSRVLKLKDQDRELFFRNRQDFWDKRLLKVRPVEMTFEFPGEEGEKVVTFSKGKRFKAHLKNSDDEVSHKAFSKLVGFFQEDADFVSLSSDEDDALSDFSAYRELFDFRVGEHRYQVVETTTEIIVREYGPEGTQDLRYHYLTGGKTPFGATWKEYGID